jgi:hypothetical protein
MGYYHVGIFLAEIFRPSLLLLFDPFDSLIPYL